MTTPTLVITGDNDVEDFMTETTDENPERVAVIQRLSWAYLRSTRTPGDDSWARAQKAFTAVSQIGTIENK